MKNIMTNLIIFFTASVIVLALIIGICMFGSFGKSIVNATGLITFGICATLTVWLILIFNPKKTWLRISVISSASAMTLMYFLYLYYHLEAYEFISSAFGFNIASSLGANALYGVINEWRKKQ